MPTRKTDRRARENAVRERARAARQKAREKERDRARAKAAKARAKAAKARARAKERARAARAKARERARVRAAKAKEREWARARAKRDREALRSIARARAATRKRDKYGRFEPAEARKVPLPKPLRGAKGRFAPAPAPLPKLPHGFEPITQPSRVSLRAIETELIERLELAGERMAAEGVDSWEVISHIQEDPGWVEAEIIINLDAEDVVSDVMTMLQSDWFDAPALPGFRYSWVIRRDPRAAPILTAEQKAEYLKDGAHRFQTYYGFNLADVTVTGIDMVDNIDKFGYQDTGYQIGFIALYSQERVTVEREPRGSLK